MLVLQALTHSTAIRPLLDIPPTRGSVQSVFPRAANLLFGGRLLTIHARETSCAPNGIVLPLRAGKGPLAALQPGMAVISERGTLSMPAANLRISTEKSQPWNPRPHLPAASCSVEQLGRNLAQLAQVLLAQGPTGGLAGLAALQGAVDASLPPGASLLLQNAWQSSLLLLEGITHQQRQLMRQAATELIGLGPGLTPAGDDLLIGFIATTVLVSEAVGLSAEFYQRLSAELLAIAHGRTTRLSLTWLEYAGRGEVAEHLGRFFHALILDDSRQLETTAFQVIKTGATSGSDLLAGVVLGGRCLLEQNTIEQGK